VPSGSLGTDHPKGVELAEIKMNTKENSAKASTEARSKTAASNDRRGRAADNAHAKSAGSLSAPRTGSKKSNTKGGLADRYLLNYVRKAKQFLKEARNELKKVKWPTRKELIATTSVVVVVVVLVSIFLGLVDFGLIKLIKIVLG